MEIIEIFRALLDKLIGHKYLKCKIKHPVCLEDYIDLIDNVNLYNEINLKMYKMIVPVTQEFYYKGQKYYAPKEWLEHFTHNLSHIKDCAPNYYLGMPDDELKHDITDIWKYNFCAIKILGHYLDEVKYMEHCNMFGYLKRIDN